MTKRLRIALLGGIVFLSVNCGRGDSPQLLPSPSPPPPSTLPPEPPGSITLISPKSGTVPRHFTIRLARVGMKETSLFATIDKVTGEDACDDVGEPGLSNIPVHGETLDITLPQETFPSGTRFNLCIRCRMPVRWNDNGAFYFPGECHTGGEIHLVIR